MIISTSLRKLAFLAGLQFFIISGFCQSDPSFCITGYYAGPANRLDSYQVEKLTHIIYSFGHLRGNRFHLGSAGDTACIRKMMSFKAKNPSLKVILSLGGWGGCSSCSGVFSSRKARREFARSVKEITDYFQTDGIDLDWEYPAIAGYPGHAYSARDKRNFTLLLKQLRQLLGRSKEISFAAGGFNQFIDSSIEWKKAMRFADKVYVMSYDLVHGFSTVSGHHTPLYSTGEQEASTDNAVNRMLAKGVAANKIVIGAAFYARVFQVADTMNRGLYRPGRFFRGISYAHLDDSLRPEKGFRLFRDEVAKAPYAFNAERKLLVTYDDPISIRAKVEYARSRGLGGIMFWQLADDAVSNGLLEVIWKVVHRK